MISTIARRPSAFIRLCATCTSESRIAVPPAGRMASMPCRIVGRSLVGPVTAPTPIEKGAMIMRSSGERYFESVAAVRWTKSIRRDMLELLSTINANVAPTASCLTMSSFCGTSFSVTENCVGGMPLRKRPVLSCTEASMRTLFTSAASEISNGSRTTLSVRFMPERVGDFHRDFAALERIVVHPLGRVGRALRDCSEELRIDVEPDLPRQDVLWMLDLRDDPHRSGQAGAPQRRGDPHAQRGFLARDWARGSAEGKKAVSATSFQLPASSFQLTVDRRKLASSYRLRGSRSCH